MGTLATLTTAWTVWKVASRRLGPVGGLVATVLVMGGLAYLAPRVAERVGEMGRVEEDTDQEERAIPIEPDP